MTQPIMTPAQCDFLVKHMLQMEPGHTVAVDTSQDRRVFQLVSIHDVVEESANGHRN